MGLPITVTTAHPVHQVASSASGGAGWHWLQRAAEMAAIAAGSGPLLSSAAALGWTWLPRVAMRTPGLEPGSISAARKFATTTLQRWGVPDREADVAVVVSELLSNAVRHALPLAPNPPDRPIRLGLLHAGPSIMCAVADPSEQVPVPREPRWLEESGRGLHVIAALSDQWGSCPAPGQPGKVVWATFRTPR
jgi:anti-sigma regulatory factor (Ser/Thr protein kinase)